MSTRWNRCRPDCGCDQNPSHYGNCSCKGGCERGSADRRQLADYAWRVMLALGRGATCPLTGRSLDVRSFEVDRVNPNRGYVPGNVCAVSAEGNSARGQLQSRGKDIPGYATYVLEVATASDFVEVSRKKDLPPSAGRVRPTIPSGEKLMSLLGGGHYA